MQIILKKRYFKARCSIQYLALRGTTLKAITEPLSYEEQIIGNILSSITVVTKNIANYMFFLEQGFQRLCGAGRITYSKQPVSSNGHRLCKILMIPKFAWYTQCILNQTCAHL